jgi:hypothetical protein
MDGNDIEIHYRHQPDRRHLTGGNSGIFCRLRRSPWPRGLWSV